MREMVTAPLSEKAQLTLPKRVRELLGLRGRGGLVGFVIDEAAHRVSVTRVDLVPADEPLTDTELRKLAKLARARRGKTFQTAEAFLEHLQTV